MATALSLKREHVYVLECDREAATIDPEHTSTRWHYRRLTAQEVWDLRDDTFSARFTDGQQSMQLKTGARQRFVLMNCLLGVEDLGDPDNVGKPLQYPGPKSSDALRLQFFDRIPSEWLGEVADAIFESSELGPELEGNSEASPVVSLTTPSEAKRTASSQ